VEPVISDVHQGLQKAITGVLTGAAWQRCIPSRPAGMHFMPNVPAHVPTEDRSIVAAAVRTTFVQRNKEAARQLLGEVVRAMRSRRPKAAEILAGLEEVALTFTSLRQERRTRIYSTNPLERLNNNVKPRTRVVGISPNTDAAVRLVGSVLLKIHEECQVGWHHFSQKRMPKMKAPKEPHLAIPLPSG
jgi:putative transposase